MAQPTDIELFAAIAEGKSLSAAARRLSLTRGTVTRRLAALEERLQVRLVQRTTQSLHLTEAGTEYYRRTLPLLLSLQEAEKAVRELDKKPQGLIRVAAPVASVEKFISPAIISFMHLYPEVDIELVLTSDYGNLVSNKLDLALAVGSLHGKHDDLVARVLLRGPIVLAATPEYLQRHGTPQTPRDLQEHRLLLVLPPDDKKAALPLLAGGEIPIQNPRLLTNTPDTTRLATLSGLGIGWLPRLLIEEDLQNGDLEVLMTDLVGDSIPVSLIYPSRTYLSSKVRALINHALEWVPLVVPSHARPDPLLGFSPHSTRIDTNGPHLENP